MPLTSPARVLSLGSYGTGANAGVIAGVTTGTGQPIKVYADQSLTFYLASQGTTSGGTVLLEEADWDDSLEQPYTGTWSQIASIAASTFTGGAQTAYHISPNSYAYVRPRISATITGGGTISVALRKW